MLCRSTDGFPDGCGPAQDLLSLEIATSPQLIELRASSSQAGHSFIQVIGNGAITFDISFARLLQYVDGAASLLASLGVRSSCRVAFWATNSLTYLLTLLGTQWLGAVVVPVNVALPPSTVGTLISTAGCSFLAVGPERLSELKTMNMRGSLTVFTLGRGVEDLGGLPDISLQSIESQRPVPAGSMRDHSIRSADLAMILHTSGTRSVPKLVPLTHRNLLYNREAVRRHWAGLLEPSSDATLGWMPFYHVIGFAHDFLGDLYLGCRYVMAELPTDRPASVDDVLKNLLIARPTVLYCVPWMLEQMKPHLEADGRVLECLRRLKLLMSGGVALSEQLGSYFAAKGIKIIDGLGMTDTAGAIFLGDPRLNNWRHLKLLPGMCAEFEPVPGLSDARELVFNRCPSATSGYLNDAEATRAAFREGRFHTADLYECLDKANGYYRYHGRVDDLFVHTGGEKTNPLPIEQAFQNSQLIERIALIGDRRPFIVALVQPRATLSTATDTEARALEAAIWAEVRQVNAKFPSFSRIRRRALEILPAGTVIPVTPKGSIKRAEVLVQFQEIIYRKYGDSLPLQEFEPLRTDFARLLASSPVSIASISSLLARLVSLFLGMEDDGPPPSDVPFSQLGFDSLAAVQFSRIASFVFGLTLPGTVIFQHPTVAALAAHVAAGIVPLSTAASSPLSGSSPSKLSSDTVSIVGCACRFPGGATSPSAFWDVLRRGQDVTSEPHDRPQLLAVYDRDVSVPGKAYVIRGGYLPQVDKFDAPFFHISDREAQELDPQQRMLLEVAWEALESASLAAKAARKGLRIGVFIGLSSHDYELLLVKQRSEMEITRHFGTGNSPATAAGRISYSFDLGGPAVTVDTACSSSLVAVHHACRALRLGECDVALAGGVNLLLAPEPWIAACKGQMLAPDGRCKAFDAKANGFVRAEGCGMVVLRRTADCSPRNHVTRALIAGSAVNQDGHSNGFTSPSGTAQQAVIAAALLDAQIAASEVQYVEAHGTGTALGDPIELDALCQAYCGSRPLAAALTVGSLKTIIGHMEACAGLGGLTKAMLALEHRQIPPHLHCTRVNPLVTNASSLRIPPPDALLPWPSAAVRRAAVSSFGISGTNAHVILQEAPPPAPAAESKLDRALHLLALSATTPAALQRLRQRLAAHLSSTSISLSDLCYTINTGRERFSFRAAHTAATPAELQAALEATLTAPERARTPSVALLFTGQGAQYQRMAQELYQTLPPFRAQLEQADMLLRTTLGYSFLSHLYGDSMWDNNNSELAQVSLFAVECALASVLLSWGLTPSFLLGHSSGEVAAACVAGLFSFDDGLALIAQRGRLMQRAAEEHKNSGLMVAVFAPLSRVADLLREDPPLSVDIAAHNGPQLVVLSGQRESVAAAAARASARGHRTKRLDDVATAFHSWLLDGVLAELEDFVAKRVRFLTPRLSLVSNVTGKVEPPSFFSRPRYWCDQARGCVQFCSGVQHLESLGVSAWVEVGPRNTLAAMARRCVSSSAAHLWAPCLSPAPEQSNWRSLLSAIGSLFTAGVDFDWAAFDRDYARRAVSDLPVYTFEQQSHWFSASSPQASKKTAPAALLTPPRTSPLSAFKESRDGSGVFELQPSDTAPLCFADHCILGREVFPGAGHLVLFLHAAASLSKTESAALQRVSFLRPLIMESPKQGLQYRVSALGHGSRSASVVSIPAGGGPPHTHAECIIAPSEPTPASSLPARTGLNMDTAGFYAYAAERGLHCGPSFSWMREAWKASEREAQVVLDHADPSLRAAERTAPISAGFMDCVLQSSFFTFSPSQATSLFLPIAVDSAQFSRLTISLPALCHVIKAEHGAADDASLTVSIRVFDAHGQLAVALRGVTFRRFVQSSFLRAHGADLLYELQLLPRPLSAPSSRVVGPLFLAGRHPALSAAFEQHAKDEGVSVSVLPSPHRPLGGATIVYFVAELDPACSPDAVSAHLQAFASDVLSQLRALSSETTAPTLLFLLASAGSGMSACAASAIAALLRSARQEHPELGWRLVEVRGDSSPRDTVRLFWDELGNSAAPPEDVSLWIDGVRNVPRLRRADFPALPSPSLDPTVSYLITGAYGGVGAHVVEWLAHSGAKHLILLARRPVPGKFEHLVARGAHLVERAIDVASITTEELLQLPSPPIGGIFHCAGVLEDKTLLRLDLDTVSRVLAPKVAGAWRLHSFSQLPQARVKHFVLFSSVASVLGSAGQAPYAMANGFLDGIASERRAKGLPVLVVNWGPWSETGMARHLSSAAAEAFTAMQPQACLAALGSLMQQEQRGQVCVMEVDWSKYRRRSSIADWLVSHSVISHADASRPAAPRDAAALLALIEEQVLRVTGSKARAGLHPDETFASFGLDSLMAVEMRNGLAEALALTLPSTLLFDYPTSKRLADYLLSLVQSTAAPASPLLPAAVRNPEDSQIAIVGYACRFPGGVVDLPSLWSLLAAGRDAITEVPKERWDAERYFSPDPDRPGCISTKCGGFLSQIDTFDAEFFGISPKEAQSMDPQQRLLLQVSWEALEGAGQLPIRRPNVGVWAAVSSHEYEHLYRQRMGEAGIDAYFATGNGASVCAGRLSYFYGFTGPSMSVDTACSSSLVAMHLACRSLREGETDMAMVAGVNLILAPDLSINFSRARMLAPDGRCKTFDSRADGYVRAEGCGVVLLKRLGDARAAGDRVLAVVKGSAVNQDGRSNGLTAPNGPSQVAVITKALTEATVSRSSVSYVEAHGTGTSLGDAIEVQALRAALEASDRPSPLLIGSIKSNIGHAEAAAGMASLGKVLAMLQHRHVPASLHVVTPNSALPLKDFARVPSQLEPWSAPAPLRSGVSSFGFSGTNAHVVLEGAIETQPTSASQILPTNLLLLSARSSGSLKSLCRAYSRYLESADPHLSLSDLCYTLAVHRAHHLPYRRAFVAQDARSLSDMLVQAGGDPSQARKRKIVLLFTGAVDASKTWRFATELAALWPPFDTLLRELSHAATMLGIPDLEGLGKSTEWKALSTSDLVDFAVAFSLGRLLLSFGIAVSSVAGTGMGVLVAAALAGLISVPEAISLATHATTADFVSFADRTLQPGQAARLARYPLLVADGRRLVTVDHAQARTGAFWARTLASTPDILDLVMGDASFVVAPLSTLSPSRATAEATLVPISAAEPPLASLFSCLGALFSDGAEIDWTTVFGHFGLCKICVGLPSYPFEPTRHWCDGSTQCPALAPPPSASPARPSPPSGSPREVIHATLCALLGVGSVPATRLLTELGFDSIMAMSLSDTVERLCGLALPLSLIFQAPTLDGICDNVARAAPAQSKLIVAPAPPTEGTDSDSFPLTDLQRSYYIALSAPDQPSCHLYLEYVTALDIARLEAAWNTLVSRHEMLRAVLTPDACQQILPSVPRYSFELSSSREAARAEMAQQKFDYQRWPLFDIRVSPSGSGEQRVLHLSFDFILFDLHSLAIIMHEWKQLYTAPDTLLPQILLSFRRFVEAEASSTASDALTASESYWSRRLSPAPSAPEIPTLPMPALAPRTYAHLERRLPVVEWDKIQRLAASMGFTKASVLLACFSAVLAKWSSEKRFAFVVTLFNRPADRPQLLDVVGDFTTTVLFATEEADAAATARTQVARTQERFLADVTHSRQHHGIRVMQRLMQLAGKPVLFPFVFTLAVKDTRRQDWDTWLGPLDYRISQTPQILLDCQLHETSNSELVVSWDFVRDAFPPALVDDMLQAFGDLLAALGTPAAWDTRPSLVPPAHLALTNRVNATSEPSYLAPALLQDGFLAQVERAPDQPCVVTPTAALTYGEMADRSALLARLLTPAATGKFVGVLLSKGWQQVVAVLGILRAGAAYVPLDPFWPADRLKAIAAQLDLACVVSISQSQRNLVPWYQGLVILLDVPSKESPSSPSTPARAAADDLAYVIFTSGSTGVPKGVAIPHRAAVNTVRDVNARFALGPSDRVFGISELHFDLSVWDIFGSLAVGACLILPDGAAKRDPRPWRGLLLEHRVTVWNSVPRLMEMLAEDTLLASSSATLPLRLVMLSGDWIPLGLPARIRQLCPSAALVGLGGATEAAIWSILYRLPPSLPPAAKSVPYGQPMKNQTFHVLDQHLDPCPIGVTGELYIGGSGLARGYLDPKQTASSFLAHPTLGRLYRTGDYGRWLPDGNVEFLGRKDTQVKVGGHRIELGDLERAALELADIRTAVALVVDESLLLSYVGEQNEAAVKAHLSGRLPAYLLPSRVVRTDSLPLTANGKIDRARLMQQLAASASPATTPVTAPDASAPLLARVVEIWSAVMKKGTVGPDQNVFELGANSLSIIRVAARIREAFSVAVSMGALFQAPTPREQSRLIAATVAVSSAAAPASIPVVDRTTELSLSWNQELVFMTEYLDQEHLCNVVPLAMRIDGPVLSAALQSALQELVRRHEILRTQFVAGEDGGHPTMRILPELTYTLCSKTCADEAALERAVADLAAQRIDLSRPPLLLAWLLTRADAVDSHVLLLVVHHIVVDGATMHVLAHELSDLYAAVSSSIARPPLPPPRLHFADFASWQRRLLAAEPPLEELAYWRRQLNDGVVPPLMLPTLHPPAVRSFSGSHYHFRVPAALSAQLRALSSANGTTLFATLLTALQLELYFRSGQRAFVIGALVPGRAAAPELESLVGYLTNPLPLLCRLGPDLSFAALLRQTHKTWLEANENELPFAYLLDQLKPPPSPLHTPLFQFLFVYQNAFTMPGLERCRVARYPASVPAAEFALTLEMEETADDIEAHMEVNRSLLPAATANRFASSLLALLASAAQKPQASLTALRGSPKTLSPTESALLKQFCSGPEAQPISIGLDDHFSFCALPLPQVVTRLRAALGTPRVQPKHVQAYPTLALFAEAASAGVV